MKLLIGLGFKSGFVLIFSFSHYPFSFSFLVPRSLFLVPCFPFPFLLPGSRFPVPCSLFLFPRSPFPVPLPCSAFSVPRFSFPVPYSLFLLLVKSLRGFRKSGCSFYYCVVFCFVLPYQHLSVMEDMLKDFMLGEHLLLVGNQVE